MVCLFGRRSFVKPGDGGVGLFSILPHLPWLQAYFQKGGECQRCFHFQLQKKKFCLRPELSSPHPGHALLHPMWKGSLFWSKYLETWSKWLGHFSDIWQPNVRGNRPPGIQTGDRALAPLKASDLPLLLFSVAQSMWLPVASTKLPPCPPFPSSKMKYLWINCFE